MKRIFKIAEFECHEVLVRLTASRQKHPKIRTSVFTRDILISKIRMEWMRQNATSLLCAQSSTILGSS